MNAKKIRGFSLIELMMVVAVVAILASVSMGFYGSYVIKANRTDARATLTEAAARLEKCKAIYGAYDNANCDVTIPAESDEGYYGVAAARATSTFTLTATPVAGKTQAKDTDCTTLTLTNTGIQSGTGNDITTCW